MILRVFALIGVIAVGGTLYIILPQGMGPPAFQAAPVESGFAGYVASGAFPDPATLAPNEELGHEVFAVPEEDGVRLAAALAAAGSMDGMAGMEGMSGMQMDGETAMTPEGGAAMQMDGDAAMTPPAGTTMQMDGDAAMTPEGGAAMQMDGAPAMTPPAGAAMQMDGDAAMTPPAGAAMQMDGDAAMTPPAGEPAGQAHADEGEEGESLGGAGLHVLAEGAPVDREIEIVMTEWAYSPGSIEAKPGERILLKVRNGGQIPHEFMFMSMPAMTAIGYRAQRADWNLLEHEALYERSLVLPGEDFQVAVEIQKPGAWMFMCMFPYHMQFGMMGGMATPGMSMQGMAM